MKSHIALALNLFLRGCDRASSLKSIFEYLQKTAPAALDCNDILRSAVVLSVSSFDLYIHDLFRLEVTHRLLAGLNVSTLRVPFDTLLHRERTAQVVVIDECIRKDHSHRSFVAPDKLAECLRNLVDSPWEQIALKHGIQATHCKNRLKEVVDLRNRIAHEADVNPAYGGVELWPIYREDVEQSIFFLRKLGVAIAETVDSS